MYPTLAWNFSCLHIPGAVMTGRWYSGRLGIHYVSEDSREFLVLLPAYPWCRDDRPVVLGVAPETSEL